MLRHRVFILAAAALAASTTAALSSGTPEEQAACRPDVIRFCKPSGSGNDEMAILFCLKENRTKISKACLKVLENNGQ